MGHDWVVHRDCIGSSADACGLAARASICPQGSFCFTPGWQQPAVAAPSARSRRKGSAAAAFLLLSWPLVLICPPFSPTPAICTPPGAGAPVRLLPVVADSTSGFNSYAFAYTAIAPVETIPLGRTTAPVTIAAVGMYQAMARRPLY